MWKFIEDWLPKQNPPAPRPEYEPKISLIVASNLGQILPWSQRLQPVRYTEAETKFWSGEAGELVVKHPLSYPPLVPETINSKSSYSYTPAFQLINYGTRPVFDVQIETLSTRVWADFDGKEAVKDYFKRDVMAECEFGVVSVLYPENPIGPQFDPLKMKNCLDNMASCVIRPHDSVEVTIRYRDLEIIKRSVITLQVQRGPKGIRVLKQETFHD